MPRALPRLLPIPRVTRHATLDAPRLGEHATNPRANETWVALRALPNQMGHVPLVHRGLVGDGATAGAAGIVPVHLSGDDPPRGTRQLNGRGMVIRMNIGWAFGHLNTRTA